MIYTLTPNPAIDLYVGLDQLKPSVVNRTYEEDYQPNGKAINISIMLSKLGITNTAMGFIGGFSGEFIEQELKEMSINTSMIYVKGITRINVFANADKEYKIVNKGPLVPHSKIVEMLEEIRRIPTNCTLCVSGSLPRGIKDDFYIEIAKICHQKNIKLILDISSHVLLECLKYKPLLIKPNDDELASLFQLSPAELTEEKIMELNNTLLKMGAQQVLVSRGEKGAIYSSPQRIVKVSSAKGEVVNTACAGDAMLSTFIGKLELNESVEDALIYASAAGAATAFSKGLCSLSHIQALISDILIETLKEESFYG
ncbi:1-phosphofructokinase [Gracilibacillus salitolerans]|uniref:Tagatose-6-phosphate kinase n=1 Tax=Gracilibacillus salitolerans TaxID=2663022 RepID=A0A5Q2TPT6_9BACI|nr:1-phosphofructokinase [Gracilibacillus salitolerans]QGH36053.1 1-phosphofructokinase [Gracilibacillus salitolerans]